MLRRQPPYFVGYLLLQVLAIAGIPAGYYPDSESYLHLSLTGANERLPTIPLFYKIFPTDFLSISAQVVLAAIAWWLLAAVAASYLVDPRARVGLRVVLLMMGLASPILTWNSLILSESVSISLTALLVAAWLDFARDQTTRKAILVVAATLFWTFARQPHVFITGLVTIVVLGAALRERRKLVAVVGVSMILIAALGSFEIHRNQTIQKRNVGAIIQQRILPNRGWTKWFVDHGMPYSSSVAARAGVPFRFNGKNPAYLAWIVAHGPSTYARFVLEHPRYTFIDPLPFFPGEQPSFRNVSHSPFAALEPNPTPSLLSPIVNYGRHRNVLPSVADKILFDQGEIGDLVVLTSLAVVLILVGSSGGWRDRRYVVPGTLVLLAIPQGYIVWISGGEAVGELDRLSMVTAVSVRIGLWIVVGVATDRLLTLRRTA